MDVSQNVQADWDESRMDVISQNGNNGEHYADLNHKVDEDDNVIPVGSR